MKRFVEYIKKFIWATAINSSLSYSRYGMYEPIVPEQIKKLKSNDVFNNHGIEL